MKISLFAATILFAGTSIESTVTASEGPAFTYRNDVEALSPLEWSKGYPTCAGSKQSPINLTETLNQHGPEPLTFTGSCPDFNMTVTSESYKTVVDGGNCTAEANGLAYNLVQFHVHTPSEHTVDGKRFDGEVDFFHKTQDGAAALVVGLFLQKTENNDTNPVLDIVIDAMSDASANTSIPMSLGSYAKYIEAYADEGLVFNYPGSTTSPPCKEFVDWWVVRKPVPISLDQLDLIVGKLTELEITDNGKNARPIQPLNGRTIMTYS